MVSPCDVAFTSDGTTGYVIDASAKKVFVFTSGTTAVKDKPAQVESFGLKQNYPNPFNPSTMITYSLAQNTQARLSVTNILGQEVAVLVDGMMSAGSHSVSFDASKFTSGIYFYHLQAGSSSLTKKMMLIK